MAAPRMVGVRVRDDSPIDRPPRVDVEIARRAVQAFAALDDQVAFRGVHRAVAGRAPGRPKPGRAPTGGSERRERGGTISARRAAPRALTPPRGAANEVSVGAPSSSGGASRTGRC